MRSVKETVRLMHLSARMIAGRRWWIVPLLVLFWPLYHAIALLGWQPEDFGPQDAQG